MVILSDPDTIYEEGLIYLPKRHFAVGQIRAALTFEYGSSTYSTLESFHLYRETPSHIGVPRYFLSRQSLNKIVGDKMKYVDLRPKFPDDYRKLDISSAVELDRPDPSLTVQRDAVQAMANEDGILSLACGKGKTPVAIHIWSTFYKTPLVVMADNTSILEQWARMLRIFVRGDFSIGKVYDGKEEWDKDVVLASVQSVYRMAEGFPVDLKRKFGVTIIDECHKVAAPVYNKVAPIFLGRRIGLTATPERTDRLEAVYQYHFGPVRYKYLLQPLTPKFYVYTPVSSKDLTSDPLFRKRIMSYGELNIQKVWTALAKNSARCQEIANIIKALAAEGRRVLVISQRKELLRDLNQRIRDSGLVISDTPLDKRTKILATSQVVLGIMGIAKEGLDSPTLDTLVICEPFRDKNLLQQVVGRILRNVEGKQNPKVVIIQDALGEGAGPIYGLARAMRAAVTNWPIEQGGPYTIEPLVLQ